MMRDFGFRTVGDADPYKIWGLTCSLSVPETIPSRLHAHFHRKRAEQNEAIHEPRRLKEDRSAARLHGYGAAGGESRGEPLGAGIHKGPA